MARHRWIPDPDNPKGRGTWVDVEEFRPRGPQVHSIITDEMAPACHPVTGEVIDSKSRFRQRTKAAGCVEMGNEPQSLRPRVDNAARASEIKESVRFASEIAGQPDHIKREKLEAFRNAK